MTYTSTIFHLKMGPSWRPRSPKCHGVPDGSMPLEKCLSLAPPELITVTPFPTLSGAGIPESPRTFYPSLSSQPIIYKSFHLGTLSFRIHSSDFLKNKKRDRSSCSTLRPPTGLLPIDRLLRMAAPREELQPMYMFPFSSWAVVPPVYSQRTCCPSSEVR